MCPLRNFDLVVELIDPELTIEENSKVFYKRLSFQKKKIFNYPADSDLVYFIPVDHLRAYSFYIFDLFDLDRLVREKYLYQFSRYNFFITIRLKCKFSEQDEYEYYDKIGATFLINPFGYETEEHLGYVDVVFDEYLAFQEKIGRSFAKYYFELAVFRKSHLISLQERSFFVLYQNKNVEEDKLPKHFFKKLKNRYSHLWP